MQITNRNDTTSRPSGIGPPENNSKGFQYVKFENSKGFNGGYAPEFNPGNSNINGPGGFGDSKGFQIGGLHDSKGFGTGFNDPAVRQYTGGDRGSNEQTSQPGLPNMDASENGRRADHKTFSTTGANVLKSHVIDDGKGNGGVI